MLDGYDIAAYDDDELARLAALGIVDIEDDTTVLVEAPIGPRLWFQQVPEAKVAKNRVHLDVRAADREDEVNRLLALGARVLDEAEGGHLTVMCDPEGNEFCIVD